MNLLAGDLGRPSCLVSYATHTQLVRYSHTLYGDTAINMLAVSYTFTKVCQRITSELNL